MKEMERKMFQSERANLVRKNDKTLINKPSKPKSYQMSNIETLTNNL